ncbi:MAG: hypothetical protein KDB79_03670 [Acidobacteria bacterium]|nr:hypothetical protein [Acidobacteriota bacterium]
MFLFLLFIVLSGFGLASISAALIYRRMYKQLRYLALSGCEFKEKKGDLIAHHPLMKKNRWEFLSEAYYFTVRPRYHHDKLEDAYKLEYREDGSLITDGDSDMYQPGSWKTKEKALEE